MENRTSIKEIVKKKRLETLNISGNRQKLKTKAISKFYVEKVVPNASEKLVKALSMSKSKSNNNSVELGAAKPKIDRFEDWASLNNLIPQQPKLHIVKTPDLPPTEEQPKEKVVESAPANLTDIEIEKLIKDYTEKAKAHEEAKAAQNRIDAMKELSKAAPKAPSVKADSGPPSRSSSVMSFASKKGKNLTKQTQNLLKVFNSNKSPSVTVKSRPTTIAEPEDVTVVEEESAIVEEPVESQVLTIKYPATEIQEYLFHSLKDSDESIDDYSRFYIHQGYIIQHQEVKRTVVEKLVSILALEFPVLRTNFYRNELIIDADLEALIHKKDVYEKSIRTKLWSETFVDEHKIDIPVFTVQKQQYELTVTESMPDLSFTTAEVYQIATKEVLKTLDPTEHLVKLILFESDNESSCFVSVCASKMIADQRTTSWLGSLFLKAYNLLMHDPSYDEYCTILKKLLHEEDSADYIDYAKVEKKSLKPSAATSFWSSMLTESLKDKLVDERIIERNVLKLQKTAESLKLLKENSLKRKKELETTLKDCVEQRKKLDALGLTDDRDHEYDENLQIEIMKVLLKEEFGGDDLVEVLTSQGVSSDAIEALNIKDLNLLAFSSLTEEIINEKRNATTTKILTKEAKKLTMIASFLRNKFRVCLEEQSRIKFNLERKIAKTRRDLQKFTESYIKYRHDFESCEDTIIKYHNLLNPPTSEVSVTECKFNFIGLPAEGIFESSYSLSNLQTSIRRKYEWYMFEIKPSINTEIKRFIKDWCVINQKQHESYKNIQMTVNDHVNLIEALFLSCFSVLLKHLTGLEKFVFGVESSGRSVGSVHGMLVGPLTNLHPFKVDFSEPGLTFNDLFDNIVQDLKTLIPFRSNPIHQVKETLNIAPNDLEMLVRFEFVSHAEYQSWQKADLQNPELNILGFEDESRIWSVDESITPRFSNDYDVKFIIIDKGDRLTGCIRHRKDLCSNQDVERWIEKLMAIIESVESGSKKLKVSSIISRFYQSVFTSQQDLKLASSLNLNE